MDRRRKTVIFKEKQSKKEIVKGRKKSHGLSFFPHVRFDYSPLQNTNNCHHARPPRNSPAWLRNETRMAVPRTLNHRRPLLARISKLTRRIQHKRCWRILILTSYFPSRLRPYSNYLPGTCSLQTFPYSHSQCFIRHYSWIYFGCILFKLGELYLLGNGIFLALSIIPLAFSKFKLNYLFCCYPIYSAWSWRHCPRFGSKIDISASRME